VRARARAVLSDLGVNRVREVDGRGAAGQHPQVTLRSEDVDLVREEVDLDALQELGRVLHVALEIRQLPQPTELLRVLRVHPSGDALLVLPVSGDAVLRAAVHFVAANLNLNPLPPRTDYGRV